MLSLSAVDTWVKRLSHDAYTIVAAKIIACRTGDLVKIKISVFRWLSYV